MSCSYLFKDKEEPSIFKIIGKNISLPLDNQIDLVLTDVNLNSKARKLGSDFIRTNNFFNTYLNDLFLEMKTPSPKQLLEMGDFLFTSAIEFIDSADLKYTVKGQVFNGYRRKVIIISADGSHPLNIEAKELKDNYGTEVMYDPYTLLESRIEAMYEPDKNIIYLSDNLLVNGSIKKDEVGNHELTHLKVQTYYNNLILYLFHGRAWTAKGTLPGRRGHYHEMLYFDEIDAFFTSVEVKIEDLFNTRSVIKQKKLSKIDEAQLNSLNLNILRDRLDNGHLVSSRSHQIYAKSLNVLRKDPQVIKFEKEGHYFIAKWAIELKDKSLFVVEIPLLIQKDNLNREELVENLMQDLNHRNLASIYFRNLFKVGLDLFDANRNSTHEKKVAEFKKFKKIFLRKYIFENSKDIPTQKQLAQSLE